MNEKRKSLEDFLNLLSIVGIAVVASLLIVLFKVKGGILGIVLGVVAVATLFYWLKEMKRVFGEEKAYRTRQAEWLYDLIEDGDGVTLVAKVPGPADEVKVRLRKGVLEIRGGGKFKRGVKVPKEVELQDRSYINGVLRVRLQKPKMPSKSRRSTGFDVDTARKRAGQDAEAH